MNTSSSGASMRASRRFYATTALVTILTGALIAPAFGDEITVPDNTKQATFSFSGNGSNSPKGPKGKDAEFYGDDDQTGGKGSDGGAATDQRVTFGSTVIGSGASGQNTVTISADGGRGGDGGDGGAMPLGGYSNGGDAGTGAAGGTASLHQTWQGQIHADSETGAKSAVVIEANGGAGGTGGSAGNRGKGGKGGDGGDGGAASLNMDSSTGIYSTVPGVAGVVLSTNGGKGGDSSSAQTSTDAAHGKDGGAGGKGGTLDASFSGWVDTTGTAIQATSHGGDGGKGGDAMTGPSAAGGKGGNAGAGGKVTVTVEGGVVQTNGDSDPSGVDTITVDGVAISVSRTTAGIHAVSQGGSGGAGGAAHDSASASGGDGGSVGSNGSTVVNVQDGVVLTSGYGSAGVIAQNIGGNGGDGAYGGGLFYGQGGNGGAAGGSSTAQIHISGEDSKVTTVGENAVGLIAQSIGGGGGYGGDASMTGVLAGVGVGGNGAIGGSAGNAILWNGDANSDFSHFSNGGVVVTKGHQSSAAVAQSIGGGGGYGGDASAKVVGGVLAASVGGSGGTGGDGGTAFAANGGVIQTGGSASHGLVAQSVGGGGGMGGAANSLDIGVQATVAIAVGGSGGQGGTGNTVHVQNDGQIATTGSDSYGMVAQSIGGGGGFGGTSVAQTIQVYNDKEFPSLDLKAAIGGDGGSGGSSSDVTAYNGGAVLTSGAGSYGIYAKSIGGGGGDGGDSSAMGMSFQASNLSVTTSVGGSGGTGGNSGKVLVDNDGFIFTAGNEANAIVAQSVGGGGGNGGFGLADTASFEENTSFQATVTVGGKGGAAGGGNDVTVTNGATGIVTAGTKAHGVYAQSVGGGGGIGGGASSKGSGGTINLNVAVGGAGGAAGNGGQITITNESSILTSGGDSAAIVAQSIGGGGGAGGSATTGKGTSPLLTVVDMIADGMGVDAELIERGNEIYEFKEKGEGAWKQFKTLKGALSKLMSATEEAAEEGGAEEGSKISVNIGGGFGGAGGSSGAGGDISITNNGDIEAQGAASEGIFAQSAGGGGGSGGASDASNSSANFAGNISIGGHAGSSGDGGNVTVNNTGAITTAGDLSHGIYGQSIGAGGGKGGVSAGNSGAFSAFSVSLGGNDSANGKGKDVTITNSGAIQTSGEDAIGIIAQTIGGGGGMANVMSTVPGTDATGGAATSKTGLIPYTTLIPISLSGDGTSSTSDGAVTNGDGGAAKVTLSKGGVMTEGRNAYGVLAQSIGGGGGAVLGVEGHPGNDFFGDKQHVGKGGAVDVALSGGARIETHGDGAAGVLAQSIGGGGGLVSGLASVDLFATSSDTNLRWTNHVGQGGNISVGIENGSRIDTYGIRAHGIVAQSAGGGGGIFGLHGGEGYVLGGAYNTCGTGCSGLVTLDIKGSVQAHGAESWGVFAQSKGNGSNGVSVSVTDGSVSGTAGGIYIDSAKGTNVVNNEGYIWGENGVALSTNGAATLNNGTPWGVVSVRGDILSTGAGWTINNTALGRIYAGSLIQSTGTMQNSGELWLGTGATNTTQITSDLISTGRIIAGVDFDAHTADALKVDGSASIGGQILINPINLRNGAVILVTAKQLLWNAPLVSNFNYDTATDKITAVDPYLFGYGTQITDTTLAVTARQKLTSAVPQTANANQKAVAAHLATLWEGGSAAGAEDALYRLASEITSEADYDKALASMTPDTLGVAAVTRATSDRAFTAAMFSCPTTAGDSSSLQEQDCFWSRGGATDMDSSSNGNATGFDSNSNMFQIGGQKQIEPGLFLGGSFAYENSRSSSDADTASINGEGAHLGVTLKQQNGPWTFAGGMTGGLGWFDSSRTITLGEDVSVAIASPKTLHLGLHGRVSYDTVMGGLYLRPQLNVDATWVRMDRFREYGSPFALDVAGDSDVILSAAPMLEIGNVFSRGDLKVHSFLKAGAAVYNDRGWSPSARFVDGAESVGRFSSDTAMPNTVAKIGAGVALISGERFEAKLEYDGEFGKDYKSNSAALRFAYRF